MTLIKIDLITLTLQMKLWKKNKKRTMNIYLRKICHWALLNQVCFQRWIQLIKSNKLKAQHAA
jgi:aryl carrier-like protein